MRKKEWIILIIVSILGLFLVYTPHINYPYPLHVDEWHHITEAMKLKQGSISQESMGLELGFHSFLLLLSLLGNLVLLYPFLPAIWALVSGLVLFFIIKKKTNNFFVSIFGMIFFFSIRSNINLTGIWFFTPLSFSIPLIFLYIYLFTEGIEKENKKMLISSLIIMLILVFVHSISVLFAIPFLIVYCLIKMKKSLKQPLLLLFLFIPVCGILFFRFLMKKPLLESFLFLLKRLEFRNGWGVLEVNNSPFELYSAIGYLLALLGIIFIIINKDRLKKYMIYLLWPISTLIYIIIYKLTGISYLSPYQRNLYYFAISLPLLSSLGLYFILETFKKIKQNKKKKILKFLIVSIMILVFFLSFFSYYQMCNKYKIYKVIDKEDYQTLKYLSNFSKAKVMTTPELGTALFSISKKDPVGSIYFYGNKTLTIDFYKTSTVKGQTDYLCAEKNRMIKENKVDYVISKKEIKCNWSELARIGNNTIYKT